MKHLDILKLCSRFVPYFLIQEMCQRWLQCCKNNLHIFETVGDSLLDNVITQPRQFYKTASNSWFNVGASVWKMMEATLKNFETYIWLCFQNINTSGKCYFS